MTKETSYIQVINVAFSDGKLIFDRHKEQKNIALST